MTNKCRSPERRSILEISVWIPRATHTLLNQTSGDLEVESCLRQLRGRSLTFSFWMGQQSLDRAGLDTLILATKDS